MNYGCWASSMAASRIGSQRDLSGRRSLRDVRHRAEAARTQQVEMVCSYDRRTYRHVRFGARSRRSQIQGGARAVSPAVCQRLAPSQVAAGAVRSLAAPSPVQGHRNIRDSLNARCLRGRTLKVPSDTRRHRRPHILESRSAFRLRYVPSYGTKVSTGLRWRRLSLRPIHKPI